MNQSMFSRTKRFFFVAALTLSLGSIEVWASEEKTALGEQCYELIHGDAEVDPQELKACFARLDDIPTLVITPTRRAVRINEVPASVGVVTKKQLDRSAPDSIAEAVRDIPGVEITDAGQAGLKRIRLRGEESRRVRVLIDGQEFSDQREVGTPLLIAPEMIEQIEVVRGAGSVLHGSRAIGGVVNLITKKGGYHPIRATVSSLYDSATEGYQLFASVFGNVKEIEYRVAGTVSEHNDREAPDGDIENTSYDNNSYSIYLAKQIEKHRFAATFDSYKSSSDVFVDPVVRFSPPFTDFRIEAPKRDRIKAGFFYDGEELSPVVDSLHLDSYYQDSDREFNTFTDIELDTGSGPVARSTSILTSSALRTFGANGQVNLNLPRSHQLILGFEAQNNELNQSRDRTVRSAGLTGPSELTFDEASQNSIEAFAEDVLSIGEDWEIRAGVRGYLVESELEETTREELSPNSTTDSHLLAASGIRYRGVEDTVFWAGWSQGFVYPTIVNLATGAFAGPDFVNPNAELDSEVSNGFELGSRYSDERVFVESTLFYTRARNFIDDVLCSRAATSCRTPVDDAERVYANIDKAQTFGLEVSGRVAIESLTPYVSGILLRRRFSDDGEKTYNTGIPTLQGRFGVQYEREVFTNARGWLDFFVRAANESDELGRRGRITHKAGYGTLNSAFGIELGERRQYKCTIELLNLADKRYVTSTENLAARGRSALVKLVATF